MSKIHVDVLAISLDGDGKIVLADEQLSQLAALADIEMAGGDGEDNSNTCVNVTRCNNSMNYPHCTNGAGHCSGSTNGQRGAPRCVPV
jgi:hypothetical protein